MLRSGRIAESLLLLMATSIAACSDVIRVEPRPPDTAETPLSPPGNGAPPSVQADESPQDRRKSPAKRLAAYAELPRSVGDYVELSGQAESNFKDGAYILLSDKARPVRVAGVKSWPAEVEGRLIQVQGVLAYHEFKGHPDSANAGDYYFLKEARWELQASAIKEDGPTNFEAAIETIATSADADAVNAAAATLRSGGLPAIEVLVSHVDDRRVPASDVLMRAVEGRIEVGTQCFWLIQGMLEDHQSKFERDYSPLTRSNIAGWLAQRKGKTLAELRVDACEGAIEKIREYQQARPNDDDYRRDMDSFRERLAKLQRLAAAEPPGAPPRDLREPSQERSQPAFRRPEPRSEIDGWWGKVGDDRETAIEIRGEQFSRSDAVAGPYLDGRATVKKREDGRYELHVTYPQVLAAISEEKLIIERQGEAIVVFGPDGKEEGEYRLARPRSEPEPVIRIHAHDLAGRDGVRGYRRKVLIIGHLGRPLQETMMTVRGVWHYPVNDVRKGYPLLFRVTHVDGQALERPVTFHQRFVHGRYKADRGAAKPEPSEGDIWEMEAFESGHLEGAAPGWDQALGLQQRAQLHHGFVTELYGVVVRVERAGKPGK